jgi:hypothetical protein
VNKAEGLHVGYTPEMVEELLKDSDKNGDGKIDFKGKRHRSLAYSVFSKLICPFSAEFMLVRQFVVLAQGAFLTAACWISRCWGQCPSLNLLEPLFALHCTTIANPPLEKGRKNQSISGTL